MYLRVNSDMLMVEVCLAELGWDCKKWDQLYQDLPSRMLKVVVKDRSIVKTANAERTCVSPEGLQGAIDALVGDIEVHKGQVRTTTGLFWVQNTVFAAWPQHTFTHARTH